MFLNVAMLVVFALVTIFFVRFIVENVSYAKRSIAAADTHCIVRAVGAIVVSVLSITAIWLEAGFYYYFA